MSADAVALLVPSGPDDRRASESSRPGGYRR
jgi:hypothetical protein